MIWTLLSSPSIPVILFAYLATESILIFGAKELKLSIDFVKGQFPKELVL